jgi:multicomponent Na+:H+ antiporter subunit G
MAGFVTTRVPATMSFVFLTAPVAAHMIARAAYFVGVSLWEGTMIDELRGHYDRRTHRLLSDAPPAEDANARLDSAEAADDAALALLPPC